MSQAYTLESDTDVLLTPVDAENVTRRQEGRTVRIGLATGAVLLLTAGVYGATHVAGQTTSAVNAHKTMSLYGAVPAGLNVAAPTVPQAPVVSQASGMKPAENLNDQNPCDTTEEPFSGLCYTKCSTLTGNAAATRIDAFTCCPKASCDVTDMFDTKTASLVPCDGYDVSNTDGPAQSCPHKYGVCLEDEEQLAGVCYEKCSILTDGKRPTRSGPASCCAGAALDCLDPFEEDVNADYAVGGGHGDGDPTTAGSPHYPDPTLTEVTAAR